MQKSLSVVYVIIFSDTDYNIIHCIAFSSCNESSINYFCICIQTQYFSIPYDALPVSFLYFCDTVF